MKNKSIIAAIVALVLIIGLWPIRHTSAQPSQNSYGPPAQVDTWTNSLFGSVYRTSSVMISNLCLGYNAGVNISTNGGTNNIYIGNTGTSGDNNVIRIGNTQSNVLISGSLGSSGSTATNITTIAQGSTGYTNTLSTDGMAYIYSTNGAISLWAGNAGTNLVEITGIPSTAGVWSFLLLPGWSITSTNLAGKFVQGP